MRHGSRLAAGFLLFAVTLSCMAGYYAGVKPIAKGKVVIVNRKFYEGPGVGSSWTSRDSYEIEGKELFNKTRKQYLTLKPAKTTAIKKVFKRDEPLTDEYIILLPDNKFFFVRSRHEIKTGYSEEFVMDGRYLFDSEGNEYELKALDSWDCRN